MTRKQFWQSASNWGFTGGLALFVVTLISWGFRFEEKGMTWPIELMHFAVIASLIVYTGRRNAANAGAEGYGYARAVSYVFAMLMFAGIVYGIGRYLMVDLIARDYYEAINAKQIEVMVRAYQGAPMGEQVRTMAEGMMTNPVFLIFTGILELVIKGGFLGLILCAFLYKKPDMFAGIGAGTGAAGGNTGRASHNAETSEISETSETSETTPRKEDDKA